jgi:hypothetical protein
LSIRKAPGIFEKQNWHEACLSVSQFLGHVPHARNLMEVAVFTPLGKDTWLVSAVETNEAARWDFHEAASLGERTQHLMKSSFLNINEPL